MKKIKTASGVTGWQAKLRKSYGSFSEFEAYDKAYGLAQRLGFANAVEAWELNPTIQGSTNPEDFRLAHRLQAVNVVEVVDGKVIGVHSFSDNKEGRALAQACFRKLGLENGATKEDLDGNVHGVHGVHGVIYFAGGYSLNLIYS